MDTGSENINDIISNLSQSDIDMLKDVAASILGNQSEKQEQNNATKSNASHQSSNMSSTLQNQLSSAGFDNIDFNMLMKAKTIFDKMNNTPNKNADLIMALKPHLKPETRDKADQAMKIIRLFEVLPLLRELF